MLPTPVRRNDAAYGFRIRGFGEELLPRLGVRVVGLRALGSKGLSCILEF